ncbi:MAG: hypothetical protein QOI80_7 [Solirubrobacteraceae bacterium]|nr:hypothetical protein [Solirubrobacteraceae bacterium]
MRGILGVVVALAIVSPAQAGSLPKVKSGHRPGPDVLYEKAARAPQLENVAPFRAKPILVSGATAYRRGEFLYQDFLYDSHGAAGVADTSDPFTVSDYTFSPKAGSLTYPSDPVYANDAADLVELRVKPLTDATAFRITLNTLNDPEKTATTIAIGNSDELRAWPFGAGVSSHAQYFLTVHGSTAELRDAGTDAPVTPAPAAAVDTERRQIVVTVPHAAWNPGTDTVALAAGVGLWDAAAGEYLAPAASRTETTPGGAAANGARLFNLAFRGHAEPFPDLSSLPAGVTIADAAAGAKYLGSWWREKAQADTLASGDVSAFKADVDFGKLARKVRDDADVPKNGPMDRILASHRVFGQGIDYAQLCGGLAAAISAYKPCEGPLVGQLQPYALYVPDKPRPARGYGFTLLMHSLSANYNQYAGSKHQSQLGERGKGSLVATPAGRGPDGFYRDVAEADSFEVWADVARRYKLDAGLSSASGYSMGGLGTFHMLSRWPDLFARGFAVVGAGDPDEDLASLRNTPIMMWNATADELVNANTYETTVRELTALGLRFTSYVFLVADHLTLATNDEYGPGADFLGTHRVHRNPAHVTYVVDPETNSPRAGSIADHAYWLSGLTVKEGAARGTIDVRSLGFGRKDPPAGSVEDGAGTLDGGSRGPTPYASQTLAWGKAPKAARADKLVVTATDVATAVVDARRARVSCHPDVDLSAAPGLVLTVKCAPLKRCRSTVVVRLPHLGGGIKRVVVRRNGRKVQLVRRGRSVRVRRGGRGAVRLRVTVRTRGGRTVTIVRRFVAC